MHRPLASNDRLSEDDGIRRASEFLGGTSRGIFQRTTPSFACIIWEKPRELSEIRTEHLPNTSRELHRGGQPLGVTLNTTSVHLRKHGKHQLPTLKIHLFWDVTPCQLVSGYGLSMPLPTGSSSPRSVILILANNQFDALFFNVSIYFPLHVSSNPVLIIRRIKLCQYIIWYISLCVGDCAYQAVTYTK
jgi:hypothetical protein